VVVVELVVVELVVVEVTADVVVGDTSDVVVDPVVNKVASTADLSSEREMDPVPQAAARRAENIAITTHRAERGIHTPSGSHPTPPYGGTPSSKLLASTRTLRE
jgi:hypothetical protein